MAGLPEAVTEDEKVTEPVFTVGDVTEGRGGAKLITEGNPESEDLVFGGTSFDTCAGGGNLQRRAEISKELSFGGSWSMRQGFGCGYTCS